MHRPTRGSSTFTSLEPRWWGRGKCRHEQRGRRRCMTGFGVYRGHAGMGDGWRQVQTRTILRYKIRKDVFTLGTIRCAPLWNVVVAHGDHR